MQVQKGFTLLEVVIGLFVFSIGIMAVASMQVIGRNALVVATQNLNNSITAVAFLEQLIGLDYHDHQLADIDDGFNPGNPDHGPEAIEHSRSTIEWEVDDDYPVPHSKRIAVTIRRIDPGGIERSIRYDYIKGLDFI